MKPENSLPTRADRERGVINAVAYGFFYDGKTPNDDVMQRYIEKDYQTPIYFPPGDYAFLRGFDFPDACYVELAPNAQFILTGEVQEYFITLRKNPARFGYAFNSYFTGGIINANDRAENGFGVYKTRHVVFQDFIVRNVLKNGIVTRTNEVADGQSFFRNILVENDYGHPGTIGIYDNALDTHFDQVEVVNFETAYDTVCGRFNACAAWLRDPSIIEHSLFARLQGFDIVFESPAVDTYRYGFEAVQRGFGAHITDMLWINNAGVYGEDLIKRYPRTIFIAPDDECRYAVSGLRLYENQYISFTNIPLPGSSFTNISTLKGLDMYQTVPGFRNDTDMGEGARCSENDFDLLTHNGMYDCVFTGEKQSATAPPVTGKGVLKVSAANGLIIQEFFGDTVRAHRVFCGGAWQPWVI